MAFHMFVPHSMAPLLEAALAAGSTSYLTLGGSPTETLALTLIMIAIEVDTLPQQIADGRVTTSPSPASLYLPAMVARICSPTCWPAPKALWPLFGSGAPCASPTT